MKKNRRILADGRDRSQGRAQGTQIRQKVSEGTFPKPVKLSASGRAIGFIEDEIDAYIDERIAERERGYVPSASVMVDL